MAFDAGMLSAVAAELRDKLTGAKITKVQQPEKDEIDLIMHIGRENHRLLISASPSAPRIHISSEQKENPIAAPMFCMLLRKHLGGARLCEVVQPGFERVLRLVFDTVDEMGFPVRRSLICEIMGKYSNIIFCGENDRILGACRAVDFTTSQKRQVLPGMTYELPPAQDKLNPLEAEAADIDAHAAERSATGELRADKFITSNYLGISSLLAREIARRTADGKYPTLGTALSAVMTDIKDGRFEPTIVRDAGGMPVEYCFTSLSLYGDGYTTDSYDSASAMLESYYGERDRAERLRAREADIIHLLGGVGGKLEKKIARQREELAECERGEEYRTRGDLITANIWAIKNGASSAVVTDYSVDPPAELTIELDSRLTAAQNAQQCYRKYTKLRNAKRELTHQIELAEAELSYIETVRDSLSRCETSADIDEVRAELVTAGIARRGAVKPSGSKLRHARMLEYETSGGYRVLCGRNNLQNDELTMKLAERDNWWFHVKDAPGSHVVLFTEGKGEPDSADFTEAATIAAVNSSLPENATAEVDYTLRRYIKKPSGSKPGFVIYTKNWSALVQADAALARKLKK